MNTSNLPTQYRTERIKQALEKLWCDNLQTACASDDDNYFICGGDSLKAIRLLSAIDREFSVRLNYTDIYEYPTFFELLSHIEAVIAANRGQEEAV